MTWIVLGVLIVYLLRRPIWRYVTKESTPVDLDDVADDGSWQYGVNEKSKERFRFTIEIEEREDSRHRSNNFGGGFWQANDPKKVDALLDIEYVDSKGVKTQREVRVSKFDSELFGGCMLAYCELRGEYRTFKFDRVSQCVDKTTGEMVSELKQFLNMVYQETPEGTREYLFDEYLDVVKVLYFVAKADGRFTKSEKELVAKYLNSLIAVEHIDIPMVTKITSKLEIPTLQAFKLAFGRVVKAGQVDPEKLHQCCIEMVGTTKNTHENEAAALEFMVRKLTPKNAA